MNKFQWCGKRYVIWKEEKLLKIWKQTVFLGGILSIFENMRKEKSWALGEVSKRKFDFFVYERYWCVLITVSELM